MKLLRVGAPGAEKPAAIDAQGRIRDLSGVMPDLTPEWLEPGKLQVLAAIDLEKLPLVGTACASACRWRASASLSASR